MTENTYHNAVSRLVFEEIRDVIVAYMTEAMERGETLPAIYNVVFTALFNNFGAITSALDADRQQATIGHACKELPRYVESWNKNRRGGGVQ